LFADESADEAFEFDGGLVVGAAFDVAGGFADGVEAFEGAEALAGGAFADAEAFDEIVEGEGFWGDEEEAVDFADGAGHSEDFDAVDEEIDHLALEGGEVVRAEDFRLRRRVHAGFYRERAVCSNFFEQRASFRGSWERGGGGF